MTDTTIAGEKAHDGKMQRPCVLIVEPEGPYLAALQNTAEPVWKKLGIRPVFQVYDGHNMEEIVAFAKDPANQIDAVVTDRNYMGLPGLTLVQQLKRGKQPFAGPVAVQSVMDISSPIDAEIRKAGGLGEYDKAADRDVLYGAIVAAVAEGKVRGNVI